MIDSGSDSFTVLVIIVQNHKPPPEGSIKRNLCSRITDSESPVCGQTKEWVASGHSSGFGCPHKSVKAQWQPWRVESQQHDQDVSVNALRCSHPGGNPTYSPCYFGGENKIYISARSQCISHPECMAPLAAQYACILPCGKIHADARSSMMSLTWPSVHLKRQQILTTC